MFGMVGNVSAGLVSKDGMDISSNGYTISVEKGAAPNLATALDELLTELFSEGVVLSEGRIADVNAVVVGLLEILKAFS